jgi:nicotinamidase-related amidase
MAGLRVMEQSALVVIDAQDAVIETAWDRDGVVARIAELADRARAENVPVIYVQHEEPDYPPMVKGADGWQIDPRISPQNGEEVVAKRYPDAFADTNLPDVLDEKKITHLVIVGAETDGCVKATVHRAMSDGWHVTLVSDGHTTSDREWEGGGITAEQIIEHTNMAFAYLAYPDRVVEVVPHDAVAFTGAEKAIS